jgi:cupin fold WbuC family metalloprotein
MTFKRISPVATQSEHKDWLALDAALLAQKAADAAASPRLREIHRLHAEDGESLHRMLNAIQPGSYVRPHRHLDPPKAEAFILLQGALGFVQFDDDGGVRRENCLLLDRERGALGVDAREGRFHAIFALAPDTVAFEVKPGPYSPVSDKDFASWAPAEGDARAKAYLMALEDRFRELFGLEPRLWE